MIRNLPWSVAVLVLFPALAMAQPNPGAGGKLPWLHEGLRLTYKDTEWIYHGTDVALHEDPNGDFCTPDGQRLSVVGRGAGTSQSGVNENVVTCMSGGYLLFAGDFYNNEQVSGLSAPVLLPQSMVTKSLSATDGGEYWQSPDILAGLQSNSVEGFTVSRIPWRIGSTTHDAIRLEFNNPAQRLYKVEVYDLHTGMGLHQATVTTGAGPQYYFPGAGQEGDTTTIQCDLAEVHDIVVPWANEPWSDSFKSLHVLHFTGEQNVVKLNARTPVQIDFTAEKWGDGFVKMGVTSTSQIAGYPPQQTKAEMLFGHASFISFWIPPAHLAKMHAGDVLDRDDPTLSKTSVTQADGNTVTIDMSNSSGGIASQYDKATGLLVAQDTTVAGIQPIETILRLTGKE